MQNNLSSEVMSIWRFPSMLISLAASFPGARRILQIQNGREAAGLTVVVAQVLAGLRWPFCDGVRSFVQSYISNVATAAVLRPSLLEGAGRATNRAPLYQKFLKIHVFSRTAKEKGDLCERYVREKSSFRAARAQFAAPLDQSLSPPR